MVHGESEKRLDIHRIAEIKAAARIFMTLHGGSGTRDEDFQQAISSDDHEKTVFYPSAGCSTKRSVPAALVP